jgi:hypothetical protein
LVSEDVFGSPRDLVLTVELYSLVLTVELYSLRVGLLSVVVAGTATFVLARIFANRTA